MRALESLRELLESLGYTLVRELGRGGMGIVFLGRQVSLDRDVALKVVVDEQWATTAVLRRSKREVALLRSVSHPNLVRLLDALLEVTPPVLVLEYIEGGTTLESEIGVPLDRAMQLLLGILKALDHIHGLGIVHRDLKPSNVLIDRCGEPRLIDFGLARGATGDETRLTQQGQVVGTFSYMAPEQMEGKDAGPAADLYAWGLVAYELVSRRRVFSAASDRAVTPPMRFMGIIPDLAQAAPTVPTGLTALITGCLARDPARRTAVAAALVESLEEMSRELAGSEVRTASAGASSQARRRRALEATRTFVPPGLARPAGPGFPSRGWAAALTAVILGLLSLLVWRLPVRPAPASSPTSSGTASKVGREPRLEVRGSELVLGLEADEPAAGTVRWHENGGARTRRFGPARQLAIAVGGKALRNAERLEVSVDGHGKLDLVPLFSEHAQALEDRLTRVKLEPIVRRAAFLVGRKTPPGTIVGQIRALLPAGLTDELEALASSCRAWIAGTTQKTLRRRLLSGIYRLEVLNSYLERQGVEGATCASLLLPEAWRERHYVYGVQDSPRFKVRPSRDRHEPRLRFGGKTIDVKVARGNGVLIQEHWLGVTGGQPKNVTENLLPDRSEPAGFTRTEWGLEFRLEAREVDQSQELLFDIYMADPGDGVLWADVNGLLEVPFSKAPGAVGTHGRHTLDRDRQLPPDLLVHGTNRVVFKIRPHPGLIDTSPLWIGSFNVLLFGPELR
ncbi:MAG: serine/threonine protein kinase [Candidatus Riflebacteria bacterium]|nr:serine/threonine protein kinase [Candidatus Riflebacteria bacterium]